LATLLAGSLLGLVLVAQPAGAATQRHWGLAVDSYGARLYVCRLPEHTKLGTMWRHYVRVANHSRVRVRATVKVTRWVFRPSHNVVKDKWVRSVPSGASTTVGSVRVWDHRASEGRFADFVDFKVVRPDGQVLEWQTLYPTGAPRCDLAPGAISWQGSGLVSPTKGRLQLCSNMFLKATGPTTRWRVRADATYATRPLTYHAFVAKVSDGTVRQSWEETFGPGGHSAPGVLTQPLDIDPSTNSWAEGFNISITEAGEEPNGWGSGIGPDNIC
jgi:hypothetical protein